MYVIRLYRTEAGMEAKAICFLFSLRCKGRTAKLEEKRDTAARTDNWKACTLFLNSSKRMHVQPAQHWQAAMRA